MPQETDPNIFSERCRLSKNFTSQRGSLVSPLSRSIYEIGKASCGLARWGD